jgi:hypothetical protein
MAEIFLIRQTWPASSPAMKQTGMKAMPGAKSRIKKSGTWIC